MTNLASLTLLLCTEFDLFPIGFSRLHWVAPHESSPLTLICPSKGLHGRSHGARESLSCVTMETSSLPMKEKGLSTLTANLYWLETNRNSMTILLQRWVLSYPVTFVTQFYLVNLFLSCLVTLFVIVYYPFTQSCYPVAPLAVYYVQISFVCGSFASYILEIFSWFVLHHTLCRSLCMWFILHHTLCRSVFGSYCIVLCADLFIFYSFCVVLCADLICGSFRIILCKDLFI